MLSASTPYPPMKPTVSPRAVVILVLGLLTPLAVANPETQPNTNAGQANGMTSASSEAAFYLPAPASTRKSSSKTSGADKQERGSFGTRPIQRKVNAERMTSYEIEENSFANGLAATAAAYRAVSSR